MRSDRNLTDRLKHGYARASRVSTGSIDYSAVVATPLKQSVTGIRLHRLSLDTRQRRRVTSQIGGLAEVFAIAFARNQVGEAGGIPG